MITYNHENFIAQAIESVMMQQTSFIVELIIGDDYSTDRTRQICLEYQLKYPDKIRLLLPEKNLGVKKNIFETLSAAQGKYIAFCEGDDYWTDTLKLQKQVNFLENNLEYSLCCHRYKIFDELSKEWLDDYGASLFENNNEGISFDNEINFQTWLTKSMTILFRKDKLDFSCFHKYHYFRDVHINYHLLKGSLGYCMNFDGAVYRVHNGGVFSSTSDMAKNIMNYKILNELYCYNSEDIVLGAAFDKVRLVFFENLRHLLIQKKYSKMVFSNLWLIVRNENSRRNYKNSVYFARKIVLSLFKSLI